MYLIEISSRMETDKNRTKNFTPIYHLAKFPSFVNGLQKIGQGALHTEDISNIDYVCLHSDSKKTQG